MTEKSRIKVVIADDEYLISLDVARCAKSAGFEVIGVVANGEQLLALVHEKSPDVVIVDIKMPKMDGLEAARRILLEKPTPVVFMTAHETPEFLASAKKAGAGAYLVKPPEPETLRRAVEIAVARHNDLMELRRVNAELAEALAKVKTLSGLLPICAWCKKVRNDKGYWESIEAFIEEHSDTHFTHGICTDCKARVRSEQEND